MEHDVDEHHQAQPVGLVNHILGSSGVLDLLLAGERLVTWYPFGLLSKAEAVPVINGAQSTS